MPTYEYACTSCGQHVEVVQSFSDEPLTTCSHCGGSLRKVFGTIGIVLKGSGFYKTDSRTPQKKAGAERSEPAASESAEKSDTASTNGSTGSSGTGDGASSPGTGRSDTATAGAASSSKSGGSGGSGSPGSSGSNQVKSKSAAG